MNRKELGKQIKQRREERELTQEALGLSAQIKMSSKTIRRVEGGEEGVSKDILKALCEHLDIIYIEDGMMPIYEINSISALIKDLVDSSDINIADKDDFDEEVLELLIEMVKLFPKKNLTLEAKLILEKKFLEILKKLKEKGVLIFYKVIKDSKFGNLKPEVFNIENLKNDRRYNYKRENYKNIEFYLYKDGSKKIFNMKNQMKYIKTKNIDYQNFYKYLDYFKIEDYPDDYKLYLEVYNYFMPEEVKYLQSRLKNLIEAAKHLPNTSYGISPCKNYISLNFKFRSEEGKKYDAKKIIGYDKKTDSEEDIIKVYTMNTFKQYFIESVNNHYLLKALFPEEIYYEILYKLGN